ncbi:AAA family ATPase [Krasilnikoviella flava]|uniref:Predicted kinase n=1 Tax=Krasilnikoviella flava TaxID=526729 RepID=A0A1T5JHN1_9MICO|nr:AAA family ATPase [Krasilnikoviella flava]SKC50866.1 Predicted kinase [Krasilnikoviella flava]
MARQVVLVNGLPGSGKTTLAGPLAALLGAPCLGKDAVKEALADAVAPEARALVGAAAMEAVWRLAAAPMARVVVESWWFRPRDLDHALRGLATAGADAVVEVWCDVPPEVARERFEARATTRHPVHSDDRDMAAEWAAWSAAGAPLALGPVVRQDTAGPVDVGALARRVMVALPGRDPRRTGATALRT